MNNFSSKAILDDISNQLRMLSKVQEDSGRVPIYWKESLGVGPHGEDYMIKRLVCFATKDAIEKFMYGKWMPIGKHMIVRAMEKHVLFYEIDGVEFLLEANSSFTEKQKSLGQKPRNFGKVNKDEGTRKQRYSKGNH